MKKERERKPIKKGLPLILFFLFGCSSPEERELQKGLQEAQKGHFRVALSYFDQVLKRAPKSESSLQAAREGSKISRLDLKDYKKSVDFDRHLILMSEDPAERVLAQKRLASTYFDSLQDYGKAAAEFSKIISLPLETGERAKYKVLLSRCYYYLGQFDQADSEILDLLKERLEPATKFAALQLRGNILVARRDYTKSAEIFRELMKMDPERAQQENISLQLALSLEEKDDFSGAIATLQPLLQTYQPAEYIELRIKRLQEKLRNRPGAKGLGRK